MSDIYSLSVSGGTGLSSDLLAGWYSVRSSAAVAAAAPSSAATTTASNQKAIIPPWDVRLAQPTPDERLRQALGGGGFVDESAAKLSSDNPTASEQKLFALYNGLARLSAIANHAADKTTSEIMLGTLNARFAEGLSQVLDYAATIKTSDLAVIAGKKATSLSAAMIVPRQLSEYTTKVFQRTLPTDPIAGLNGSEQFTIAVTKGGATTNVDINLADLGQTTVSLDDLVTLVNKRLADAGMKTRIGKQRIYSKTADGKDPSPLPQTWGLKIQGTSTEKLTFSAPAAGTAVYLAGPSGKPGESTAQMLKLDASGAAPALMTSARIEAVDPNAKAAAKVTASGTTTTPATSKTPATTTIAAPPKTTAGGSAIDAEGNVYVVGTTEGSLGGEVLQGTSDVYLTKYDSTGQVVWQRMMGAADSAEGTSVAVDASGNAVITGRVQSAFNGSATNKSYNSFVAKFDSKGQEIFTRDVGPLSDDGATAVTVGADGSIYFGGHTKGVIASGQTSAGGDDAFITKLSATGSLVYTRQFGTSGNDHVTNLKLDGDGNLVALTMRGSHAVVTKFNSSDGAAPALWSQDLGDLAGGDASALAIDSGKILAGGSTATGGVGGGTVQGSYHGGTDGFVVALDSAGALQSTTYVGSGSTDRIRSIAAANGEIFVAGDTTGDLGGGFAGTVNGFAAKLNASGALDWVYQYSGRNGQARANAINVDPHGSSVLDVIGLPKGKLDYTEATTLTAQSTVRAGDEFSISVNGGPARKVIIKEKDTLNSLAQHINAILVLDGKAATTHVKGGSSLRISPVAAGARIDLIAGPAGRDALKGLGLPEGTIVDDTKPSTSSDAPVDPVLQRIFGSDGPAAALTYVGLNLTSDLKIDTRSGANVVNQSLQTAMSALRNTFRTLTTNTSSTNGPGNKGGKVPSYMMEQIANYRAGLARLSSSAPNTTTLL